MLRESFEWFGLVVFGIGDDLCGAADEIGALQHLFTALGMGEHLGTGMLCLLLVNNVHKTCISAVLAALVRL